MRADAPDRDGDGGFALLVALVALVAVTGLAAGGLWLSGSGFASTEAFTTGRRAFNAADAALQDYLGSADGTPPASATYDLGNGRSATVQAVRVRSDPDVHHLTATGRVEVGGRVVATRTLGVAAAVNRGPLPEPPSALYSPTGIEKSGASGTISGMDGYDPDDAPPACQGTSTRDVNGVVVPQGGYDQSGGNLVPEGSPEDVAERTQEAMLDSLNLDWQAVVDGEAMPFDYTVDPDDVDGTWPAYGQIDDDEWPVIYSGGGHDSNLSLESGHSGHGVLIVRGDLIMNGGFTWDGLIYVGGDITSNGNQTVNGAMMGGLNLLIGESIDGSNLLNGTKTFQFNSCYSHRSMGAMARLQAVAGTWYQGEEGS